MRFLHSMIRVQNLDESLYFFCELLGLVEVHRTDSSEGRFTLAYLAAPADLPQATETHAPLIELTYNWDSESYEGGRNFGHLALEVDDIYALCQKLMDAGVAILRPPRDGRMAFIRSPDQISIEFLQKGAALAPQEPWVSMPSTGSW